MRSGMTLHTCVPRSRACGLRPVPLRLLRACRPGLLASRSFSRRACRSSLESPLGRGRRSFAFLAENPEAFLRMFLVCRAKDLLKRSWPRFEPLSPGGDAAGECEGYEAPLEGRITNGCGSRSPETPEEAFEHDQELQLLARVLDGLSPAEREVLRRRFESDARPRTDLPLVSPSRSMRCTRSYAEQSHTPARASDAPNSSKSA